MLPRIQRIAAAIELFALVLWIGGLFFLMAFVTPAVLATYPDKDAAWVFLSAILARFKGLEMVFAAVVLLSNFMKLVVFRDVFNLQRVALMVSAMMLVITISLSQFVGPRIEEKLTEMATMTQPNQKLERPKLDRLRTQQKVLISVNLLLGLFLVYSYRSFEERKLQALARIIKMP